MDVTMPQLGETVTEGTITRWLKQVGDHVDADEPLFEVSTDKVDSEVPAPAAGVVTEILVPEGETVEVGTRLAVVGDAAGAPAPAAAAGARAAPSPHRRPSLRREPEPEPAPEPAPGTGARAGTGTRACPAPPPPRRRSLQRRARAGPSPARGGRRRRAAGDAGSDSVAHVADRAPARRRARPRRLDHPGHRPRWTHHPQGRRSTPPHRTPDARRRRPPPRRPRPAPARRSGTGPRPRPGAAHPPRRPAPAAPRRARTGSGAGTRPARTRATRSIPFDNIRRRTAEHMVQSLATSAHVYTSIEVDFERVERVRAAHRAEWKATRGLLAHLPAVHRPRVLRHRARVPEGQRERRRRRAGGAPRRQPLDRGRPRLQGPRRAGDPRRRRQAPAPHRARDPRPRRARPHQEAGARRRARRHVHHHQPGPVRHLRHVADHQPAAGGDPLDRRHQEAARWSSTGPDGDDTIAIHHTGLLVLTWDHRAFDGAYAAAFLRGMRDVLEQHNWEAELD